MRTHCSRPLGRIHRLLVPLLVAGAFSVGATGCSGDDAAENQEISPVEDTVAPVDPTVEPAD